MLNVSNKALHAAQSLRSRLYIVRNWHIFTVSTIHNSQTIKRSGCISVLDMHCNHLGEGSSDHRQSFSLDLS